MEAPLQKVQVTYKIFLLYSCKFFTISIESILYKVHNVGEPANTSARAGEVFIFAIDGSIIAGTGSVTRASA